MFTLHAPCKDECQAKVGGALARLRAARCGRAMIRKPLGPRDPAPQAPHTLAKLARVDTREAQQVLRTWAEGGAGGQGVATRGWELGATPSLSPQGTSTGSQWAGRASQGRGAGGLSPAPSFGLALV